MKPRRVAALGAAPSNLHDLLTAIRGGSSSSALCQFLVRRWDPPTPIAKAALDQLRMPRAAMFAHCPPRALHSAPQLQAPVSIETP